MEEIKENKENLEFFEKRIIKIQDIFKNYESINLNGKKLEMFLNGVKLEVSLQDGVYKIFDENRSFLGTGIVSKRYSKKRCYNIKISNNKLISYYCLFFINL